MNALLAFFAKNAPTTLAKLLVGLVAPGIVSAGAPGSLIASATGKVALILVGQTPTYKDADEKAVSEAAHDLFLAALGHYGLQLPTADVGAVLTAASQQLATRFP